jgi:predicted nucleic acid-binding protein
VIAYLDTSVLLKLLVDDESGSEGAERLWLESDFVVCAEIGYTEARAALASARRAARLDDRALSAAKVELRSLWAQMDVVPVTSDLIVAAGALAEAEALRGYDAVHLAAAISAEATVFAAADDRLLVAARRRRFDVSNPLQGPGA